MECEPPDHGTTKTKRRTITVIVNGREKTIDDRVLTFAEVIELAFDDPPSGPQVMFSVTYRRGRGDKPEGTLVDGGQVRAKNQMVFNVTATDKS